MITQSSRTIERVQEVPLKHRIYLDITTNDINQGTGVFGTNNRFTVNPNIILNLQEKYTLKVIEFSYINIATPANIRPIILCDCTAPIYVNNTTSSIIYKGSVLTGNTNRITLNESNNSTLILDVDRNNLNSISFQIVRNDNGQPFPFNSPSDVVTMILEFENKV